MPKTATTMAPEETVLAGIRYTTVVTHVKAPRDSKNNLIMDIHLNHKTHEAICFCADLENVGAHPLREVQFTACDDCILYFDNLKVFGTDHVELFRDITSSRPVAGTINNQRTSYWVEYMPKAAAATSMQSTAPTVASIKPFAPPVIVVP